MTTAASPDDDTTRPPGATRIARVGGVPVYLANSWPMGLLLLAFLYGSQLWSSGLPPVSVGLFTLMLVVMLVASVIIHEGSHAFTGRALGYRVRSVVLSLWGGATMSTHPHPTPLRAGLMSLSGPLANLSLAAVAWVADRALLTNDAAHLVLQTLWWMNLFLGIFNALPGLPMDGGGVVEAVVWAVTGSRSRGRLVAAWGGRVVAVAVALWYLAPLLNGGRFDVGNAWMLFVAFFLWTGASSSIKSAKVHAQLDSIRVAQVSLPGTVVAATTPVGELREVLAGGRVPVVVDGGRILGVVPEVPGDPDLQHLPAARYVLPAPAELLELTPDGGIEDLLARMQLAGSEILVGRYPTGEPRVVTAAQLVAALERGDSRATT